MPLTLYNTLTRRKEAFVPLDPSNVRVYVCGPTVYDDAHIGNARAVVVFDLLYRVLRHEYGADHVTYVRNITDVEDKIMAAARASGQTIDQVTARTTAQFHADMAALGNLPPDIEPRATEYIPQMIALIERLIASGHAYAAEGHALFRVGSYSKYGVLSRRSRADMIAGARVEVAPYKEDPGDFVLWKPSTPDQPGWDSPWGRGRPGWHIECSAMSWKHLGETFDIHGGGIDLVFPHHENELAQSCCAFHESRMANFWMHNGFLQVEGEKMSKSLGNFVTIRELLSSWTGAVIRYSMLQTHYRQPIDWTVSRLEQSRQELGNWAAMYSGSEAHTDYQRRKFKKETSRPTQELVEALGDDLNTPNAVAVLRRQFSEKSSTAGLTADFFQNCEFLGLLNGENIGALEDTHVSGSNVKPRLLFEAIPYVLNYRVGIANKLPEIVQRAEADLANIGVRAAIRRDAFVDLVPLDKSSELDSAAIDALIEERGAARARKDFKESDRIRDELAAMKVILKDGKDANGNPVTTWEIAR